MLRISRVIGIRSYIGEILRDKHLSHLIVHELYSKVKMLHKGKGKKKTGKKVYIVNLVAWLIHTQGKVGFRQQSW